MAVDAVDSGTAFRTEGYGFPGRERVEPTGSSRRGERPGTRPAPQGKDGGDSLTLSPEAEAQVAKLKARDQQVRAHEAAHMSAGGGLVRGGASYSYQTGPDGRSYAVGGEVSLDAGPVPGDPQATRMKAMRLQAAALAPADPSPQDHAVAASAARMAAEASAEAARQAVAEVFPAGNPETAAAPAPSGAQGNAARTAYGAQPARSLGLGLDRIA